MDKKKILFFIFDLGHGGAEKVLVQLVQALDPNQYDITVQTIFNVGVNKDSLPGYVHRKWLFNKQFRGMRYFIRLFPPTFLHRSLIKDHYDYEIAYLEGIPTKVISGCRDCQTRTFAWVHTQMSDRKTFFNTYNSVREAEHCYRHFDKVAFVSEVARDSFLEKTNWKGLHTAVIHNTIDVDSIKAMALEPICFAIDRSVINLCSVGRLTSLKGYVRLIHILGELVKDGLNNWHLYLLGDGSLRDDISNTICKEGLSGFVTMLGYDLNPYKYVSKMDWFVCSSYKEGYSTAVTESVIVGTPVVTTDCAGMREILGTEAGFIVDNTDDALKNALELVLTDKSLFVKYKKGAIGRSSTFSREKTLKEFEDFIIDR